jgi:hypothetical protein
MKILFLLLLLLSLWGHAQSNKVTSIATDTIGFATKLETLRQRYQIPSLSVGIVQGK